MANYPKVGTPEGIKAMHRVIAEKALGRPLKGEEQVHHIDEDKNNFNNNNLVICPNQVYHNLLHIRTAAYDACGHADWRKCFVCGVYADPTDMINAGYNPNGKYKHKTCKTPGGRAYSAMIRKRRRLELKR